MEVACSQGSSNWGSPGTVDTGGDHSAKKQRLELLLPSAPAAKQEAAGANVAAEHVPTMEVGMKMDVTVLHCPLCFRPFKTPVFQATGTCLILFRRGTVQGRHLACAGCLAAGYGKCEGGDAVTFDVPNTAMDAVVSAARVECLDDGCGRFVTYHEVQDHGDACQHAPCRCTEAGCGFAGPVPALVAHLAADHDMPVHKIPYGKIQRIQVSVPEPARRLLVGEEDEGGAFLLTLSPLGTATVVSAVCIRAEACPWPRYTVKMWANGPPLAAPAANRKTDTVLADFEATSSTAPGAVKFDELVSYLTVPRQYLVGDGLSKELPLHIRIEKTISS